MIKNIDFDLGIYYYYTNKITNAGQWTLKQFLNGERQEHSFRPQIDAIRSLPYHSSEYNAIKATLPIFWIGGHSLTKRRRRSEAIPHNIFSIDIDRVDNTELFDRCDIEEIKNDLFSMTPGCFCAMRSCGGQGIVLYILLDNINDNNEKLYFQYFYELFKKNGINIDTQTKDIITRGRYPSYDKDILIRDKVEPFVLPEQFIKENKANRPALNNNKAEGITINDIKDIAYLDNERRKGYVMTLKKHFSPAEAARITKEIYDKFHYKRPGSSAIEAYKHIDGHANSSWAYEVPQIVEELRLLGVLAEPKEKDIYLKENEYLYDKKDILLRSFKRGINMLVSGTGTGKTELWNFLAHEDKKSIIVVEPYNSVVMGKYNVKHTHIAAGTKKFIDEKYDYNATNYFKFIKYMEKEDEEQKEYDYLVIDESHLIGMQDFRGEQLVQFVDAVKKYKDRHPYSKIILQTATPSNEEHFFDIDKIINIHKEDKRHISIKYTFNECQKKTAGREKTCDRNIVKSVLHYIDEYIKEGRKTYVYWGNIGIDLAKVMQLIKNSTSQYKTAIFHSKNGENEDMEYIKEKRMMGIYDLLIGSCFFSVGCDLNDEEDAAIIIVGNNTIQEDEQVIGRFRKSKDIKVNIIVNQICDIKKVDVSEILKGKIIENELRNKTHDIRPKSMIRKGHNEEYNEDECYIECSKYYFSDLKRKFDYYNNKGYIIENELKVNDDLGQVSYDILEDDMPIIYIIDDDTDILEEAGKRMIKNTNVMKEEILERLRNDLSYDLTKLFNKTKDNNVLHNWVEGMHALRHYNIRYILDNIDDETIMNVNKTLMNPLLRYKIKIKDNHYDIVERHIIEKLIDIYDKMKDKKEFNFYLAQGYIYFCEHYEEDKSYVYDLTNGYPKYPLYENWKEQIRGIININKKLRDHIINYEEVERSPYDECLKDFFGYEGSIDEFFGYDDDKKIEEKYEIFKNKFIHKTEYERFLKHQFLKIKKAKSYEKQEIIIDGKTYKNMTEAAKNLGISRKTLYKRLNALIN